MPRCIGGYQGLHRRVVVTEQLTPCNVEGLAHEVYMADSREAPGGSSSYDLLWCLRHYPCGIAQQAGLLVQHGATSKFQSAKLKINSFVLTLLPHVKLCLSHPAEFTPYVRSTDSLYQSYTQLTPNKARMCPSIQLDNEHASNFFPPIMDMDSSATYILHLRSCLSSIS